MHNAWLPACIYALLQYYDNTRLPKYPPRATLNFPPPSIRTIDMKFTCCTCSSLSLELQTRCDVQAKKAFLVELQRHELEQDARARPIDDDVHPRDT
eukprot:278687-Pleurochrysis_carterae.AAC.1